MRVGQVRLSLRSPKYYFRFPSLARYSAGVQRLRKSDAKSSLEQYRIVLLAPTIFNSSKFCVLRVPIANITPVGWPVSVSASLFHRYAIHE